MAFLKMMLNMKFGILVWPVPRDWNLVEQTPSSNNTREDSTHGHHQRLNAEIRLTILFAAEDGEALYSQPKQVQELTVAQIMNSLRQNSHLNWIQ